jgi:hypothetical protein
VTAAPLGFDRRLYRAWLNQRAGRGVVISTDGSTEPGSTSGRVSTKLNQRALIDAAVPEGYGSGG